MSGPDLGEFRTAFLGEADELLRGASAALLEAEREIRVGRQAPRAVREAFRSMHTLKGLAAMVQLEPIVALAHGMEAVLRQADRGAGRLGSEAIDVLVHVLRAVEARVSAVARGAEPPPPDPALLEELAALERGGDEAAPPGAGLSLPPELLGRLGGFEREQLAQALAEGRRAVRVDFAPSRERAAAGLTITSVRERVGRLGEIVKVLPRSLPVGPDAPTGVSFALLVATQAPDEELARAAGVDAAAVVSLGASRAPPPPDAAGDGAAADRWEPAGEAAGPERTEYVRVEVPRLDDAMDRLSALVVTRFRLARAAAALAARGVDARELAAPLEDLGRGLREMRGAVLRLRLVRVAHVLERILLLVRGLRRSTGRSVRAEVDAGSAELDKAVAERIFPAIVHLVRNAVDHAIEPAEARRAAGKPEEGTVRVSAVERSSAQLEVTVADDGRGIDAAEVAARAGAPMPESDAELLALLCRPGLSTRDRATTTSGRGMGMDIVRRAVAQLGGDLTLRTTPGAGSAFSLRIPLTISIVDAFTLESGGERFVVPVAAVEEIVDFDPAGLVEAPAGDGRSVPLLARRGEAVALLDLREALGLAAERVRGTKAVVVRRSGRAFAFAVDRMLGRQEVVLRPLEDPLVRAPGISASTDLGDGRPTLVLDLPALSGAIVGDRPEGRA